MNFLVLLVSGLVWGRLQVCVVVILVFEIALCGNARPHRGYEIVEIGNHYFKLFYIDDVLAGIAH